MKTNIIQKHNKGKKTKKAKKSNNTTNANNTKKRLIKENEKGKIFGKRTMKGSGKSSGGKSGSHSVNPPGNKTKKSWHIFGPKKLLTRQEQVVKDLGHKNYISKFLSPISPKHKKLAELHERATIIGNSERRPTDQMPIPQSLQSKKEEHNYKLYIAGLEDYHNTHTKSPEEQKNLASYIGLQNSSSRILKKPEQIFKNPYVDVYSKAYELISQIELNKTGVLPENYEEQKQIAAELNKRNHLSRQRQTKGNKGPGLYEILIDGQIKDYMARNRLKKLPEDLKKEYKKAVEIAKKNKKSLKDESKLEMEEFDPRVLGYLSKIHDLRYPNQISIPITNPYKTALEKQQLQKIIPPPIPEPYQNSEKSVVVINDGTSYTIPMVSLPPVISRKGNSVTAFNDSGNQYTIPFENPGQSIPKVNLPEIPQESLYADLRLDPITSVSPLSPHAQIIANNPDIFGKLVTPPPPLFPRKGARPAAPAAPAAPTPPIPEGYIEVETPEGKKIIQFSDAPRFYLEQDRLAAQEAAYQTEQAIAIENLRAAAVVSNYDRQQSLIRKRTNPLPLQKRSAQQLPNIDPKSS